MSFLTLFKSDCGWLATDQRVFSADEISNLNSAVDASEELSKQIDIRKEADRAAFEQGRAEGFKVGEKTAIEAGRVETAAQLLRLTQEHRQVAQHLQESAVLLAIEIVKRIAGELEPVDWMIAQARTAVAELVDVPDVTLKVHVSRLQGVRDKLQAQDQTIVKKVCGVDDVHLDFCQLETPAGNIDVDLETQLQRISELLASPSLAGTAFP